MSCFDFNNSAHISFFQELLKHETCIIRFNDVCIPINNGAYYISKNNFPIVNNFDLCMSILDLIYVYFNTFRNLNNFDCFINDLINKGLILEMELGNTSSQNLSQVFDVYLNNQGLLETSISKEGIYRYFYILDKLKEGNVKDEIIRNLISTKGDKCYKTAYGELLKLFRYEVALPNYLQKSSSTNFISSPYYVLEAYMLPFIEEYSFKRDIDIMQLCNSQREYNCICESLKEKLKDNSGRAFITKYQYQVILNLISKINEPKTTVISAPTGAGKTYIFLFYALARLLTKKGYVLILYPTRSLAREQLETFIQVLYYMGKYCNRNIHIYILDRDSKRKKELDRDKNLEGFEFRGGINIENYVIKYHLEGNSQQYELFLFDKSNNRPSAKIDWISEIKDLNYSELQEPAIIISNPSMISRHLQESVGNNMWIDALLDKIHTIILDEAHYYINSKERLDFLHFFFLRLLLTILSKSGTYSNIGKDLENLVKVRSFDIILSSATIEERNLLNNISLKNLGGLNTLAILSQYSVSKRFDLRILFKGPLEIFNRNLIYITYQDVLKDAITNDHNISNRLEKRIVFTALFFPSPSNQSRTPFIEALNSSLLWSLGIALRNDMNYVPHVLAFVDSKESQGEIFRDFVRRGLVSERFHEDKLLIPIINPESSKKSKKVLEDLIQYTRNSNDFTNFLRYSHLQFFIDFDNIKNLISSQQKINSQNLAPLINITNAITDSARNFSRGTNVLQIAHNNIQLNYLIRHNADIKTSERNAIERILTSKYWNVCVSTSTLELGVNLSNVNVVLQYGAPPSGDSFLQRIGRSGRNNESFRVSFGAVFLRNFGKDIMYIDENKAFDELFNMKFTLVNPNIDSETFKRYSILLYEELTQKLGIAGINVKKILQRIANSYGLDSNIIDKIENIYNNRLEFLSQTKKLKRTKKIYEYGTPVQELIREIKKNLEAINGILSRYYSNSYIYLSDEIHNVNKLLQLLKRYTLHDFLIANFHNFYEEFNNIAQSVKNLKMLEDEDRSDIEDSFEESDSYLKQLVSINLLNDYGIISASKHNINGLVKERIDYFILGNYAPHPAVISNISGTKLEISHIDDLSIEKGYYVATVKIKDNQYTSASRFQIIRNIPFKYSK